MRGLKEAVVHVHRGGPLVALLGNPNCDKTSLFNRLTGSHQKGANCAGVTVERKEGRFATLAGKTLRLLDLPGAYSLYPRSPDERVTVDVLRGQAQGEKRPDLLLCVVDASHLRRQLLQRLGLDQALPVTGSDRLDALLLQRWLGPLVLLLLLAAGLFGLAYLAAFLVFSLATALGG